MAGVLSFSLGLDPGVFATGIDRAAHRLLAFLAIGESGKKIFEGVWGAIERGPALVGLSARTGESIAELVKLQAGFEASGLSAESVAPMVLRIQKALTGVTDEGEQTDKIFKQIGLDMDAMKKMDASDRIAALGQALSKLDKESATGVASKLLGRFQAGDLLQIARSKNSFQDATSKAAPAADVIARSAEAFKKIEEAINSVKRNIGGMFAGIAEGLAPVIQKVADLFDGVDWVGIGAKIGSVFTGLINSWKVGQLGNVLQMALVSAFMSFGDFVSGFFPALVQRLGGMLLKALTAPLTGVSAMLDWLIQNAMAGLAKIPGLAKVLPELKGFKAESFSEIIARHDKEGLKFNVGFGDFTPDDIIKGATADMKKAVENMSGDWAETLRVINSFSTHVQERMSKAETGTSVPNVLSKDRSKPDVTALEKIGLIIGSGGGRTNEYAASTAASTARIAEQGKAMLEIQQKILEKTGFSHLQ